MSKKFSNTTADYLEWHQAMNLVRKLFDDKNYRMSLLIALGCFWGLRISDLLSLKWQDVYNMNDFIIIEKKTQKNREIKINAQLTQLGLFASKNVKKSRKTHFFHIFQNPMCLSINA